MTASHDRGRALRIGGASGFWGDSSVAAPQLVRAGVDVLVFDYLAETTMAILAAARAKNPELGYATDFVDVAMRSVLREAAARGVRVVANAGGVNPRGCAAALRRLAEELGVAVRIATVDGDDIAERLPALIEAGAVSFDDGPVALEADAARGREATRERLAAQGRVASANAYLGAAPIAQALAAGADIVVTGRVVDSALVLGPLLHAFGWRLDDPDELDRLAMGSLAGHLVECGCQATGGLFTDWRRVPDWPTIGYPIVECEADGSFVLTKPAGSGGLVVREAVCEQLLYEIGDPAAYALPDVVCDFAGVTIEDDGADRVRVRGARGRPPGDRLKVSATGRRGWRAAGMLVIVGDEAVAKAERTGEAIVARTRALLAEHGLDDFASTHVEVIGAETSYGPHSRARGAREVMLRVVADHADRRALEIFAREIAPAGTSWAPGTTGPGLGRPQPSPLIAPFSLWLDRRAIAARVTIDGETRAVADTPCRREKSDGSRRPEMTGSIAAAAVLGPVAPKTTTRVRLLDLAVARSGDKGDLSNIGVVARRRALLPLLLDVLTAERVRAHLAHLVRGRVERFVLPGIAALNFVLHEALDGGGMASRRLDPLGKGMAQLLLSMELDVAADALSAGDMTGEAERALGVRRASRLA